MTPIAILTGDRDLSALFFYWLVFSTYFVDNHNDITEHSAQRHNIFYRQITIILQNIQYNAVTYFVDKSHWHYKPFTTTSSSSFSTNQSNIIKHWVPHISTGRTFLVAWPLPQHLPCRPPRVGQSNEVPMATFGLPMSPSFYKFLVGHFFEDVPRLDSDRGEMLYTGRPALVQRWMSGWIDKHWQVYLVCVSSRCMPRTR